MNEKRIISACFKDRDTIGKIPIDMEFSQIAEGILDLLIEYYDLDKDVKSCHPEALITRLGPKFQGQAEYNAAYDFVTQLPKLDETSVPNVVKDIQEYKKQLAHQELANCLAVGNDKEIDEALEKYAQAKLIAEQADKVEESKVYKNVSVRSLVDQYFSEAGLIKLWPAQLNKLCGGGARPGHHILLFARPEVGKTLFAQNLVAGFLSQKLKVLYVGNEDPASDILIRQIARLARISKDQVRENPEKAEELALENGYDLLAVADLAPGNFREIRALVEKEKPQVVVLDQLRNIDVGDESRVQALEKAATEARNLAKRYKVLVVSVTQAGDSAEGKEILARNDVDSSKTGIPAQVDLMVGIGANPQQEKANYRTISLPKNKLSGNHGNFTFSIDPRTGVVLSQ